MYIIGDVHGCYKTLMALVDKLPTNAELCFVGDLIDRGPMAKEVVEFVRNNNHHCVKGNHEDMMVNRDYSLSDLQNFLHNGGSQTLQSYTSPQDDDLLLEHSLWMENLPLYLEFPELTRDGRKLVVSHSSIARMWDKRESVSLSQLEQYVLWNRDVSHGTLPSSNDIYNVFGHTVQKEPIVKDFFACIDTGCCYPNKGYHKLTALHFPSLEVTTQDNID